MLKIIKKRAKERSTWIGLSGFFAALGYRYTEATIDTIAEFGVILCSLILVLFPDSNNTTPLQDDNANQK
jgi:hypothetical protein